MDSRPVVPRPYNEPVRTYAPGSAEQKSLQDRLSAFLADDPVELTHTVAGRQFVGKGDTIDVVRPDRHRHVLGRIREATAEEVAQAVESARAAAPGWRELPFAQRAAVLVRAADLLTGPWRDTLNAATMLGQSKSCFQAEIDAACELADFWRWNVGFAEEIYAEHPVSAPGTWNRLDQRSLEGFVLAVTPFNFTAIAGNLPTAPALMGNTVVWKPSPTQAFAAHQTLRLLEAAGLPPGVINLV
ncbi:MAG: aldehyde dehydrogenase family protein, partial [Mycobacteriales bacterium]